MPKFGFLRRTNRQKLLLGLLFSGGLLLAACDGVSTNQSRFSPNPHHYTNLADDYPNRGTVVSRGCCSVVWGGP